MSTFSVKGVLSLDGSQFAGAMGQASRSVDRFAASVGRGLTNKIAGLFTLGAAEEVTRATIRFAGNIQDLSERLGVSVEWLQEMQYVMKQNGGTAEDLAKVLEKIADARKMALGGTAASAKPLAAFAKFGLDPGQLSTTGAQGLIEKIAAAFKKGGSTETLNQAFREIGGRSARNLVASFVDGIEQGRAAAQSAGAVMSEEQVAQLDDIGDQFTMMWQELLVAVGPIILYVTNLVRDMFLDFRADALAAYGFISHLDIAGLIKTLFTKGPEEAAAELVKQGMEGINQAQDNYKAQTEADHDAEIARNDALNARQNERRKRQKPDKIDYIPYEEKTPKQSIVSDALTAVGNFLGSNTQSTLTRLAQRQVDLLTNIDRNMTKLAANSDAGEGDFAND